MTRKQLRNLKFFSIENKHGKIEWANNVDLDGVDLEKIVKIKERYIEVYPDDCLKP